MTENLDTIDLSKYHKSELYDSLDELLAIRQRIVWVWLAMVAASLLGIIILPLLFATQGVHWSILILVAAYGVFAGAVLGLAAAITWLIDKAFDQVIGVLDLSLEMTRDASHDVSDLASGETRWPAASEFAEMVFRQMVWPAVETVITRKLGWIAKPFLMIYRLVLRRVSKRVLAEVDSGTPQSASNPVAEPAVETSLPDGEDRASLIAADSEILQTAAGFVQTIAVWVDSTREVLSSLSATLRGFVVGPLYAGFVVACCVAAVPPVMVWWLAARQ